MGEIHRHLGQAPGSVPGESMAMVRRRLIVFLLQYSREPICQYPIEMMATQTHCRKGNSIQFHIMFACLRCRVTHTTAVYSRSDNMAVHDIHTHLGTWLCSEMEIEPAARSALFDDIRQCEYVGTRYSVLYSSCV
jgi:hypothetical protein